MLLPVRKAVLKHAQSRRFATLKAAGHRGASGLRRFTAAFAFVSRDPPVCFPNSMTT